MAPRRSFTLAMPDSDPRSARIWQHLSRIGADADASAELRALICAALDQTARLDRIEDKLDQTTRLDRIEAKLDQTARLDRIEDKLDRLIDGASCGMICRRRRRRLIPSTRRSSPPCLILGRCVLRPFTASGDFTTPLIPALCNTGSCTVTPCSSQGPCEGRNTAWGCRKQA